MLLIVEGSNRVGKSTLIKNIKHWYPETMIVDCRTHKLFTENSDIQKCNYSVAVATYYMVKAIQETYPEAILILDRFHLSEIVYGKYDRGYDASEQMLEIDAMFAELDTRIILLTSQYNHLHDYEDAQVVRFKGLQLLMCVAYNYSSIPSTHISLDGMINEGELIDPNFIVDLIENPEVFADGKQVIENCCS